MLATPLSRRQFIRISLLTGAAFATGSVPIWGYDKVDPKVIDAYTSQKVPIKTLIKSSELYYFKVKMANRTVSSPGIIPFPNLFRDSDNYVNLAHYNLNSGVVVSERIIDEGQLVKKIKDLEAVESIPRLKLINNMEQFLNNNSGKIGLLQKMSESDDKGTKLRAVRKLINYSNRYKSSSPLTSEYRANLKNLEERINTTGSHKPSKPSNPTISYSDEDPEFKSDQDRINWALKKLSTPHPPDLESEPPQNNLTDSDLKFYANTAYEILDSKLRNLSKSQDDSIGDTAGMAIRILLPQYAIGVEIGQGINSIMYCMDEVSNKNGKKQLKALYKKLKSMDISARKNYFKNRPEEAALLFEGKAYGEFINKALECTLYQIVDEAGKYTAKKVTEYVLSKVAKDMIIGRFLNGTSYYKDSQIRFYSNSFQTTFEILDISSYVADQLPKSKKFIEELRKTKEIIDQVKEHYVSISPSEQQLSTPQGLKIITN